MSKVNPSARRQARRFALQALYQWQLAGGALSAIEGQFFADKNISKADKGYFRELLHEIPAQKTILDGHMTAYLDRSIDQLDPVELAILRVAVYELAMRLDVPYRVIINEALELAKTFGAIDSYKYVNGVLDQVARKLRAIEVEAASAQRK